MTVFHATPYNIDAAGFYFESLCEFEQKSEAHVDRFGCKVEEYEIQFIDGEDAELFEACNINQSNLNTWFDEIELLSDFDKSNLYYLQAVAGYDLQQALGKVNDVVIVQSKLLDAASELFDECYLHALPDSLKCYMDYDKFARDCELSGDMCEFEYGCQTYTCTNANSI